MVNGCIVRFIRPITYIPMASPSYLELGSFGGLMGNLKKEEEGNLKKIQYFIVYMVRIYLGERKRVFVLYDIHVYRGALESVYIQYTMSCMYEHDVDFG